MIRGYRTFSEFEQAGEGIATNILANRLRRLEAARILRAEGQRQDRRRVSYRLTEKGIDLAPVLLELLIWGARHERTSATAAAADVIERMARHREAVLAEVRRRWAERDVRPLQVRGRWTRL